jgi:hypothetical protein
MPIRPTPFPLPDTAIMLLTPEEMAAAAVAAVRRGYGVELDYTPASLRRLDDGVVARMTPGQYPPARYPAALAMLLGAYAGEVLRRTVDGGKWGDRDEDIFATPFPFLLYTRGEYARQINVVEDVMAFLWSGDGLPPGAYCDEMLAALHRLGFTAPPAASAA